MGTVFRIVLYAVSDSVAQQASRAAFQRIDQLNDILSDYKEDSELSRLSATAGSQQPVKVSDELWQVLVLSQQAARLSSGAFDITVGPLVQLWRRSRRQSLLPTEEALRKARQSVGYKYIQLEPKSRTALLTRPDMKLDAGGIGKGYAVDEALKQVTEYGITSALVDGGGNLAIGASPPGQTGWRVAIGVDDSGDTTQAVYLQLSNVGVSTSGDMFQYAEINGKRYSHIVDPFTGYGMNTRRTVSVIAPNGTTADWLSTAICVIDDAKARRMIREMKRVQVWSWNEGQVNAFASAESQQLSSPALNPDPKRKPK
jgi:thiamine biosynthesis lipoprotein